MPRQRMNPTRLEAFSDGVIGVIIAIMVCGEMARGEPARRA